jgi:primosomal protein N' (replication factor Y)
MAHILDTLIPNIFLDKIQIPKIQKNTKTNYVYTDTEKQLEYIEKEIHKNIRSDMSVAIICPTVLQVENLHTHFKKIFSTVKYHGEETAKKQLIAAENITDEKPKLLITTPSALFLADAHIGQVFLYNDSSRYYYSAFTHVHMNTLVSNLCEELCIPLTILDTVPSIMRYVNIVKSDTENNILDIDKKIPVYIIKMNGEDKKEKNIYISRELNKNILKLIKAGESFVTNAEKDSGKKIVLYTQRKGSHTTSVCADCGDIKKCPTCDRPLVLYVTSRNAVDEREERSYVCQNCKTREKVNTEKELLCGKCGSWRMETLGIGTNGLHSEIQKLYPDTPVFVLDTEYAKTKKSAIKIYKAFLESAKVKTSILIGTELMLPLLENVNLLAIISIDSLFAIPEYNMDAHVFSLLHNLQEKIQDSTKYPLILQTRNKEKVFDFVTENTIRDFLENELTTRHTMHMPPYTTVLTIDAEFEMKIPTFLSHYTHHTVRIQKIYRTICFVDTHIWETDAVLRDLCRLNLHTYNLQINPEFLLRI